MISYFNILAASYVYKFQRSFSLLLIYPSISAEMTYDRIQGKIAIGLRTQSLTHSNLFPHPGYGSRAACLGVSREVLCLRPFVHSVSLTIFQNNSRIDSHLKYQTDRVLTGSFHNVSANKIFTTIACCKNKQRSKQTNKQSIKQKQNKISKQQQQQLSNHHSPAYTQII